MNCKPGDLAYIVESAFPENLGRVVEVIDAYGMFRDEGFCWNIRANSPLTGEGEIDGTIMFLCEGFIQDACLRPISGVPIESDVKDEMSA